MWLVLALVVGYAALLVGLWALGRAAALGDRAKETGAMELEFYGGPKDGDREVVTGDVYPVVTTVPVALSPWGREDREASDLCRVVRLGVYVRTPQGMAWRAE